MASITSLNRNSLITHPKTRANFKKKFIEKLDLHSNKIGYLPIVGIFIGSRRMYRALSSKKPNKWEVLRGSLETLCCGPLLAFIDAIIQSVKKISSHMKKQKKKDDSSIDISTFNKITLKISNYAQISRTDTKYISIKKN